MKRLYTGLVLATTLMLVGTNAMANKMSTFTDGTWTDFTSGTGEDITTFPADGYVNPGYGGQAFDAEYLLYKRVGNILYLGLQTGFNLDTGKVASGGKNYYAGDLALSFNGTPTTYEYAVNFGMDKKGYTNSPTIPTTSPGLYSVSTWNLDVYSGYTASNPFAMQTGTIVTGALTSNTSQYDNTLKSYNRIVAIDLATLGLASAGFDLSAHWTMSCGNDDINGQAFVAPVPEPATMLLFGTGIAGLAGIARRRRMHN